MSRQSSDSAKLAHSLSLFSNGADVNIAQVSDWCSATFRGHSVEFRMTLTGPDQIVQASRIQAALVDHAFSLPRQIVADILVLQINELGNGEVVLKIEALLLDD
jgi:hypothetical protein